MNYLIWPLPHPWDIVCLAGALTVAACAFKMALWRPKKVPVEPPKAKPTPRVTEGPDRIHKAERRGQFGSVGQGGATRRMMRDQIKREESPFKAHLFELMRNRKER